MTSCLLFDDICRPFEKCFGPAALAVNLLPLYDLNGNILKSIMKILSKKFKFVKFFIIGEGIISDASFSKMDNEKQLIVNF